jgi:hypothetical protein
MKWDEASRIASSMGIPVITRDPKGLPASLFTVYLCGVLRFLDQSKPGLLPAQHRVVLLIATYRNR